MTTQSNWVSQYQTSIFTLNSHVSLLESLRMTCQPHECFVFETDDLLQSIGLHMLQEGTYYVPCRRINMPRTGDHVIGLNSWCTRVKILVEYSEYIPAGCGCNQQQCFVILKILCTLIHETISSTKSRQGRANLM